MVSTRRTYSIHDIVRFEVFDRSGFPRRLLDKTDIQLRNFESCGTATSDFTVEIGPFRRQHRSCFILDDRYYVGRNYFYCRDERKYARWELEVCGVESSPTIRLHANLAGYYTAPINIIDFFIHYTVLRKGLVMIHASGVVHDGTCWLFAARGGGGKTTVALTLVGNGSQYLGDNYILARRGRALSFISPLNIFSYNRLPIVERNLTARQKTSLACKQLIYQLTGGYIKIFEKVDPALLLAEKIVPEGDIERMFILDPHSAVEPETVSVKRIAFGTAVRKLRYNMELDFQLFNKYIFSYAYVNPRSFWASFWDRYEQALIENLPSTIPCYIVRVPLKYTARTASRLIQVMESLRSTPTAPEI